MSFFSSVKGYFDKRAESRKEDEKYKEEMRRLESIEFEKEFKKAAQKAARIRARQEAEEKTGLAKLRAISQANAPAGALSDKFQKFREYRQANLMRREQNMKRHRAMVNAMKQERQRKIEESQKKRLLAKARSRGFTNNPGVRPIRGLRGENLQRRIP